MAGINNIICTLPEKFCFFTFQADSLIHSSCPSKRVTSSGFFISLHKNRVFRIHEQDLIIVSCLFHAVQHHFQFIKSTPAPGIDSKRNIPYVLTLHFRKKGSEFLQKLNRKIIHAEIIHILQHLKCGGFSRS